MLVFLSANIFWFLWNLQYKSELRHNKNITILESLNSTKSTQRVKNILTQ